METALIFFLIAAVVIYFLLAFRIFIALLLAAIVVFWWQPGQIKVWYDKASGYIETCRSLSRNLTS